MNMDYGGIRMATCAWVKPQTGFIQKPSNTIVQCVAAVNGASVLTQRGLQDSECFRDLQFVDTTVSKGCKNLSLTVSFAAFD